MARPKRRLLVLIALFSIFMLGCDSNYFSDKYYGNEGARLLVEGEFDKAEKMTKIAIKLNPDCSLWYHNLGFILINQGENDAAFKAFKKSLEVDNEWVNAHKTASLTFMGIHYNEKRMYAESISFFEKALQEAEKEQESKINISRLYIYLSFNYDETEIENSFLDLEKSEQLKERALALTPDDTYAKASFTSLLIKQGKISEARRNMSQLENEIENLADSEKGIVYASLAYMYSMLNSPSQSASKMSEAIKLSPIHYSVYLLNELDGDFRNVSDSVEMQPVIENAKAIAEK